MTYGQVKALQEEIKKKKMYNTLMSQSLDPDAMLETVMTTIDVQDTFFDFISFIFVNAIQLITGRLDELLG